MNFISQFLKTILEWVYGLVGNYGWSVILFTLLIRFVLLPLDVRSKRSMRAMNRVNPKIQALQKKYANDKEKLNVKMNELYRKEKINPLAGCLPMLLTLPILFCMFTAMRVVANEETVRMLIEWASHFTEGGEEALRAAVASGKDAVSNLILSWDASVAQGLDATFNPQFQSFMWIKNVYQPDSFTSTIMPAVDAIARSGIRVVEGTYLTQDNITIAEAFLASDTYKVLLQNMGGNNFMQLKIPFLFTAFTLTIPNSWDALMASANGLFILPILSMVTQFVYTMVTPQPQATSANGQGGTGAFMKWFFPIFSLFICATSSAAFSLYWAVVNIIMIIQQWGVDWYLNKQEAKNNINEEALKP